MKRFLYILIASALMMFLGSCRTSRKTSYHENVSVEVQTSQLEQKTEIYNQETEINQQIRKTVFDNEEVYIVYYDTDKPVDKETGKPPVKAEVRKKRNTRTNEADSSSIVVATAIKDSISVKTEAEIKEDKKVEEVKETEASAATGSDFLPFFISIAVILGIGYTLRHILKNVC